MDKRTELLSNAGKKYRSLMNLVGKPVPDSDREKIQLYVDYPRKYATFNGKFWDIPEYTNGTTRRVQCLFLIAPLHTGNGTHAYVGSEEEIEEKLVASEREKILASDTINGILIEVVWSFDIEKPNRDGQYYYSIDAFWFGVRINGKLVKKEWILSQLTVPDLIQKCGYCEKENSIAKMTYSGFQYKWVCSDPKPELYGKCPE
jgi:hypothetical protein